MFEKALTYDEIAIVPRVVSTLKHRSEANPRMEIEYRFYLPIIISPMPDVCNHEMALTAIEKGCLPIIHRFQSIEDQSLGGSIGIPYAIGATGDYKERVKYHHDRGATIFCLDTANGANKQVEEAVNFLRKEYDDLFIIAGNVASGEGYKWLAEIGVDAVRVGIAGGRVCTTKIETGVHCPMVTSIIECVEVKDTLKNGPLIIADGGIRNPADYCKALALGADAVMMGSVFAGCKESPGKTIKVDGKLFKVHRGAASFSVQQDSGKEPYYVEGNETLVPYQGSAMDVIDRYSAGLASSMSYLDATNLTTYRANASFVRI